MKYVKELRTLYILTHYFQLDDIAFAISLDIWSNACVIASLEPRHSLKREIVAAHDCSFSVMSYW